MPPAMCSILFNWELRTLRQPQRFYGYALRISSNPGGEFPGSSLGSLNGSFNPVTGSAYAYTPTSDLTLLPNNFYFIVLTAGTTIANGAYEWSESSYPLVQAAAGVKIMLFSIPVIAVYTGCRLHI